MTFSTRSQLTAEQRVSKALVNIIDHKNYIALAGVLMMGSKEVRDDVPTAATNGRDEWYGREFVDSLTDPELRFLILHECYHKLYRHLTTWKHLHDKDHRLANMSCDHVINLQILSDKSVNDDGTLFVEMPRCKETGQLMGLADTRFSGMNSEEVFTILYAEQEEQQQSGESEQGDGEGFDDHDWEGAESMSDEEQQQLAEQIDTAIRQGALTAGKVGSGGNRAIDSLLQPEINWVDVLSEFVTETCRGTDYSTYARPNRRYMSAGMYMPSGVSEQVDELVIAIDTSGSIGQAELTKFLSEVQGVVSNVNVNKIRVLYWDTKICADETYEAEDIDRLVESTKPAGGGGTDISCVNEYMAEHNINPQAVIVCTDGYLGGDWGTWNSPVLWCILGHDTARPNVGTAVHVNL